MTERAPDDSASDTPPDLREMRIQLVRVVAYTVVYMYLEVTVLLPGFEAQGLSGTAALLVVAAIVGSGVATCWIMATAALTPDFARAEMAHPTALAIAWTLPGGLCAFFFATGWGRLPFGGALAFAAACYIFAARIVRKNFLEFHHARVQRPITLANATDAEELIAQCRERLLDPSVAGYARSSIELNLATGLVALSTLAGEYDGLPEVQEILERSLDEGSPGLAYYGAERYVEAMIVRARRSEDLDGVQEALDLLLSAAAGASRHVPHALSEAYSQRANGLLLLSMRAGSDGDSERAERLLTEAVTDLQHALALAPRWSRLRAQRTIELAWFNGMHPRGDLDAAIEQCRWALRRLRFRRLRLRETGYLVLMDLLARRGTKEPDRADPDRADPDRAEADLAEAVALGRAVVDRGSVTSLALAWLPALLARSGAADAEVGREYRRAFAALSAFSLGEAGLLAAQWSQWAANGDHTEEAAEAHWCWIRTVVDESRRRMLRTEQERELAEIQGLAANAGVWLLAAGRSRDAAVALDLGRAVQLTERMYRQRPGLQQRLVDAGRQDLADRWHDVVERIARADRTAFDARVGQSGPSAIQFGGQRFAARFSSSEYVALADHERLLREISRIPGFEDVDASPTYDDLRAAAQEGPLVYIAAIEDGVVAVIVSAASTEPEVMVLPDVSSADVELRARRLVDAGQYFDVADEVEEVLDWLWQHIMEPLTSALPRPALVTLVPLGALGLLPLHAAGMDRLADGSWHNRTEGLVFRYTPNARVLLRARATARDAGDANLPILTVDVAHAPGETPLQYATAESHAVAAQFAADGLVRRPASGSVDDVLAALGQAAIWHFACHGDHDPAEPLESCLRLADGPLTLRAMFARPSGRQRLAVLSACKTAMANETLLDEVVSFPSALLQAGVAGVVSSHTVVPDRAAMLLVLRFFDGFRRGIEPARALADAQIWLSGATNRQIHDAFPAVHPFPDHHPDRARVSWETQCEFGDPHNWAIFGYSGA